MCTFQRKTKPAPKSEESSKRKPSPVHPPCQTVSVTSLDSDSDFDCIDISLDNTKASSGNISKDESKNALQSSKGSISFDSGHTSHKENASIVIANESDIPKVNAGIEMVSLKLNFQFVLQADQTSGLGWVVFLLNYFENLSIV